MSQVHNLDENVTEYFEFVVKGHQYKFRQMNTEESEKLVALGDDDKKTKEYLFTFITPVDEKSPSFKEISKKMLAPHWVKFRDMCKAEFGGLGGN